ncbi:MAG: superoxide dismutase [Limisphaerales bacterium]
MPHELPPLPYANNALEPALDAATMEIHHGRHHKAYVDNLNKALAGNADLEAKPLEALIADLASVPDAIRGPVRNNGGGHWNHGYFWRTMTPGGSPPSGKLADEINATFGSLDEFKAKFEAAGLGRFGSGWVWLLRSPAGKLEIASTANQDNPLMGKAVAGCEGKALLGCDVWEHAYYLKYQNKRADYLKAWWSVVNWAEVAKNA